MTRQRRHISSNRGFALIYLTVTLSTLVLFSGLAVDTGRAYIVKAQLTKAVDGAALAAARNLNSGDPKAEAARIFKANFPPGYLGTSDVTNPATDAGFFDLQTIEESGVNVITVTASAKLPTTFMRLAAFDELTVTSSGEARRRMVDLCLSLDVSSSIGGSWPAVRDASRAFVGAFDEDNDRMALVLYSNGARVLDQMPAARGFDKVKVMADIPAALPGGSTNMVEGLYRCWDEVRAVAPGQQSGLRVIVLFTDGASNSVPGEYPASPGVAKGLRTFDFPKHPPDPDNQTWNSPQIVGLYDTESGVQGPSYSRTVAWNSNLTIPQVPFLPLESWHTHHRSVGIQTAFPLQTAGLMVDGAPQNARRALRNWNPGAGRFPAEVWNINNAARNLVEIIANEARDDDGDYPIRIYTLGMGELVRYNLGTRPEKSEDILMRIANDTRAPDYNEDQLEGKYYFAQTAADVGPAFQALQSQIIRLSK